LKIDAPFCIERSLSDALFRPITRVNRGQLVLYLPGLLLLLRDNNMQLLLRDNNMQLLLRDNNMQLLLLDNHMLLLLRDNNMQLLLLDNNMQLLFVIFRSRSRSMRTENTAS
jgi:hypothetical protein